MSGREYQADKLTDTPYSGASPSPRGHICYQVTPRPAV
jgi:hypothetical protein